MRFDNKKRVAKRILSTVLTMSLAVSILDCPFLKTFPQNVLQNTTAKAASNVYGLQNDVQDGVILHCWNWSYNNIKNNMKLIAESGYSAIQTSPVTQPKDYTYDGEVSNDVGIPDGCGGSEGNWWKLYQPVSENICDNGETWLGTKDEFKEMCSEAEKYGVKVIVDIVANHMANIKGWQNSLSDVSPQVGKYCNPDMLTDPSFWHINTTQCWYSDGRYDITRGSIGMPDLNTADKRVQNMILNLLKECVDCGADGFRFDAAKHIETPDDDSSFASDFWPTVINGIRNYADHDLFIYGEILNTVGDNFDIGSYTKYMSVTDNSTGDHILSDVRYNNASSAGSAGARYQKDKTVLWAESHDTYMGGPSYLTTDKMIKDTWSIVAAKEDSTALYFARPYYSKDILVNDNVDGNKINKSEIKEAQMGEVGTMTWCDPSVAAVNKFHNYFAGQGERVSSNGNIVYTERGNSGVVVANLSGAGNISIPVYNMSNGIYKDQVSGNTFTVSNGTLSGNIASSDGIAVIYNPTIVTPTPSPSTPVTPSPSTSATVSPTPSASTPITVEANTIYVKNTAKWSNVYCYMWNSSSDRNASWPGIKMNYLGDNVWSYKMSSSYKNVIFNNGSGTQTADLVSPGAGYIYDNQTSSFTKLPGSTQTTTSPEPTTSPVTDTYKVYCKNTAGWSNVYCYMWNSTSDTIGSWPGVAMKNEGNNIWSVEVSKSYKNVIFTNGSGTQTGDLSYPGADYVYNNGSGSWSQK